MNALIAALEEKREAESLSDGQFAEKLGISRPLYSLMRSKDGEFKGLALIKGTLRCYPDLLNLVLEELMA